MIPTLPGIGDVPQGPQGPAPIQVPPPSIACGCPDDFEGLKNAVQKIQAEVESLEARVSRLEANVRIR